MCPYDQEIEKIKNQIVNRYHPENIILFGSCAKGRVTKNSDIDICIVLDTTDKRETQRNVLSEVESDIDLEVVVFTPREWLEYKDDKATFAGIIHQTGVNLLG